MRTKSLRRRLTHRRIPRSAQQQQQQQQTSFDADLLDNDSDTLLLSAASILLREHTSDGFELSAADVDFSSFQALLEAAATSATAAPDPDPATKAATATDIAGDTNAIRAQPTSAIGASTHSKSRRERNRISCRKTRIKRKVEQARADLIERKRAEYGEFLSELHLELATRDAPARAKVLDRQRMARHLVARSVHLQLMDPEYDASWCFVPSPHAARAANAKLDMAAQWRAIATDFAVADLSILQIRDGDQSDTVSCKWCVIGTPTEKFQDGSSQSERRSVTGVTHVRFRAQLVASVEMRVTNSSTFDIAV